MVLKKMYQYQFFSIFQYFNISIIGYTLYENKRGPGTRRVAFSGGTHGARCRVPVAGTSGTQDQDEVKGVHGSEGQTHHHTHGRVTSLLVLFTFTSLALPVPPEYKISAACANHSLP